MSKLSFVIKDDDIVGFLHVSPEGNVHSEEDIENVFDQLMDVHPVYKEREPWNKPDLIGVVKGHINWFKPNEVQPKKIYNLL